MAHRETTCLGTPAAMEAIIDSKKKFRLTVPPLPKPPTRRP